jgi:type I restriction-modification system DNA methylase subunit
MRPDLKKFIQIFDKIAHGHSYNSVFNDFLDIIICCLSNAKYEDDYLAIAKKYGKEKMEVLTELFAELVIQMDNEGRGLVDVIGEFFQQHITKGQNGQFFTPQHITDFMSEIVSGGNGQLIHDPACGSGRMLLSGAKSLGKFNRFYGSDIDPTCCKMTTVNLCLNGLQGEIAWMNSLSFEHWGGYKIRIEEVKGYYCPVITKLKAGEGFLAQKPVIKSDTVSPGQQIKLF